MRRPRRPASRAGAGNRSAAGRAAPHAGRIALPDTLDGDRLVLRRWDGTHVDALVDATITSLDQLRPWMDWAQEAPTTASARSVIEQSRRRFDAGGDFEYFTFELGTGQLVGAAALHLRRPDTGEVGYWVRSDRHRRGYATEATVVLTRAAFAHLPTVTGVEIRMDQANTASARVAAKAGFRLRGEDEMRDRVAPGHTGRGWIWTLDRTTWQNAGPH